MSDGARDRKAPQAKGERRGAKPKAPGDASAGLRENPIWRGLAILGSGATALQTQAASGASDDPLEREADRAAARLVGPVILREGSALRLQPLDSGAVAAPEPETSAPALLAADDAAELAPGQMRKAEFLEALRAALCPAVDEVLAAAGRSTEGCPYLELVLSHYRRRSVAEGEAALRRYVPEAAGAASAQEYLPALVERARVSAARWVETGALPDLPRSMPGGASPPQPKASVQRKGEPGDPAGADPRAVQSELGPGRSLDLAVRAPMESALGADFSGVRVHTDAAASHLARRLRARAFAVGSDVAFGEGQYRPGTAVGDALIAHELAHVVQQGAGSGRALAEGAADAQPARLADQASTPGRFGPGWAGLRATGLRLRRCSYAEAPADLDTAEAKAQWIDEAVTEDLSLTGREVVKVFQSAKSVAEFIEIQDQLDMAAILEYLEPWEAVQVGALGPVVAGADTLNRKRAEFIIEATHDYGPNLGQAFTHYVFTTMYTDDMQAVLRILGEENRLSDTVLVMDAVKDVIHERGLTLAEYADRDETLADFGRGMGRALSDLWRTSEIEKSKTGQTYLRRVMGLPEPYQKLLHEVEKKQFEAALTPGNVILGAIDYVAFGIPGGVYGLVVGTGKGVWDLAQGEYDKAGYELTGAAVVVLSALGIRAYRAAAARTTAVVGPTGAGQFVIKGFTGPVPKEVARLGAVLSLSGEGQAAGGLLISRIGEQGLLKVARYVQADSRAAVFVHRNGLVGVEALHEAGGNLTAAKALLKQPAAGLLPEISTTTEQLAVTLIADSNKAFPLTRVNALRAVRGPQGAVAEVAGPGGAGSDVTFRSGATVLLQREVKAIAGTAQGSFNKEVSHAAVQVGLAGEILVQVPAGTDAARMVARFRGARTAADLDKYKPVQITIVDPGGKVLFDGPLGE